MRRGLLVLALVGLVVCGGCTVNQQFVTAVDGYTTVILPEYKKYIDDDPNLSEDTKRIRKQSADKFQELVDEAKEKED